jgi:hypothetical protein
LSETNKTVAGAILAPTGISTSAGHIKYRRSKEKGC